MEGQPPASIFGVAGNGNDDARDVCDVAASTPATVSSNASDLVSEAPEQVVDGRAFRDRIGIGRVE
jgi:hypothetical protein